MEVRSIVDQCYARAEEIIVQNRDKLIALAEALIEYETLDAPEVNEIIDTGKLSHPPARRAGIGKTASPPAPPAVQPEAKPGVVPGIGPSPANA
jgi:cell division protease FtsH